MQFNDEFQIKKVGEEPVQRRLHDLSCKLILPFFVQSQVQRHNTVEPKVELKDEVQFYS